LIEIGQKFEQTETYVCSNWRREWCCG